MDNTVADVSMLNLTECGYGYQAARLQLAELEQGVFLLGPGALGCWRLTHTRFEDLGPPGPLVYRAAACRSVAWWRIRRQLPCPARPARSVHPHLAPGRALLSSLSDGHPPLPGYSPRPCLIPPSPPTPPPPAAEAALQSEVDAHYAAHGSSGAALGSQAMRDEYAALKVAGSRGGGG